MKSRLSQFVNRAVDDEGNILTPPITAIKTRKCPPLNHFSPPPNPNITTGEIKEKPIIANTANCNIPDGFTT